MKLVVFQILSIFLLIAPAHSQGLLDNYSADNVRGISMTCKVENGQFVEFRLSPNGSVTVGGQPAPITERQGNVVAHKYTSMGLLNTVTVIDFDQKIISVRESFMEGKTKEDVYEHLALSQQLSLYKKVLSQIENGSVYECF